MNRYLATFLIVMAFASVFGSNARADEYSELMKYDWEKSRKPLAMIEENVREAETPRQYNEIAEHMVAVLNSDEAGYPAKQFACRICRRITDKVAIPALSEILTDPELSHMARFALQGSPHAEAGEVLRKAMEELEGDLKVGDIGTLSMREDQKIVPQLKELARGSDENMAAAALVAIGNIGTPKAARALVNMQLEQNLQQHLFDAQLKCAEQILEEEKDRIASKIYLSLYENADSEPVQVAALQGIARSMQNKEGVEILVKALTGEQAGLRDAAKRYFAKSPGEKVTKAIADLLPEVADEVKLTLLDIIEVRGDTVAMPPMLKLVESENSELRIEAIKTLGAVGNASVVSRLVEIASSPNDPASDAAYQTLKELEAPEVADTMIELMETAGTDEKMSLLNVMSARSNPRFAPVVLEVAEDKEEDLRKKAIETLGKIAREEHIASIVDLFLATENRSEQNGLMKAMVRSALRSSDVAERASPIVAAMELADSQEKIMLMKALGRLGGGDALSAIIEQTTAEDNEVALTAVETLAEWNTAKPAPDLLNLAKNSDKSDIKSAALRGYINMAAIVAEDSSEESLDMYEDAIEMANTNKQRKAVLAGLATAESFEAFRMAESLLDEDGVREEAEMALVSIAENSYQNAPEQICSVIEDVARRTENENLKARIESVVEKAKKHLGFVTSWKISGPYSEGDLFDEEYAPEKSDEDADWKPLNKGVGEREIDLEKACGGENRVVYLQTAVRSPAEQKLLLSMGSDDGIKVWLNGELVHANDTKRGVHIGDDEATATLEKGWNKLLVKVVQHGGHWGVAIRLCDPEGDPLEDIKISASHF